MKENSISTAEDRTLDSCDVKRVLSSLGHTGHPSVQTDTVGKGQ